MAIDPFSQQVTQYSNVNVQVPSVSATLPRCNSFDWGQISQFSDLSLKATMYNIILNPNKNITTIAPNCATGNCTFPAENGKSFSTAAVCHQCAEITHLINTTCSNSIHLPLHNRTVRRCNITLPNGWVLRIPTETPETMMFANSSLVFPDVALQTIGTAFSNFSMLSFAFNGSHIPQWTLSYPKQEYSFFAAECALSFCVKSYTASITNNILTEDVVSTSFGLPKHPTSLTHAQIVPEICVIDGKPHNISSLAETHPKDETYIPLETLYRGKPMYLPDDCVYQIWEIYTIAAYFRDFFTGSVEIAADWSIRSRPDVLQALYNNGQPTLASINSTFANIAMALTNHMRVNGQRGKPALGAVWKDEVHLNVAWAWLSLPITLVLLSVIFLLATIVKSANANVWKSSSLALLYHGLVDDGHTGQVDRLDEMQSLARQQRVVLERRTSGEDLKLTRTSLTKPA